MSSKGSFTLRWQCIYIVGNAVHYEQEFAENRNSVWIRVFKKPNHPKFVIRSDGFPTETACNLPFKQKVDRSNVTRIKCAHKERFKTRPKQEFNTDFRMQLHYLLVVIVVSDVSDVEVMSSTVAVIFAIT